MWGPTIPELVEALSGVQIMDRSSVNVFDDPRVASAIEATGRRKLIFAGLSLEVCAAFPAITAVSKGLHAYVAVDACGTFSETKRQVGLLRMSQAGVILSDYATLMDNSQRQRSARGRCCLWSDGYGLGQVGRPDGPSPRQVNGAPPALSDQIGCVYRSPFLAHRVVLLRHAHAPWRASSRAGCKGERSLNRHALAKRILHAAPFSVPLFGAKGRTANQLRLTR